MEKKTSYLNQAVAEVNPIRTLRFPVFNTCYRAKIFFLVSFFFCIFFIAPVTYACDPLGCLLNGHKQDTLILGEAVSVTESGWSIRIIFIFPQNRLDSLKVEDIITVSQIARTINWTEEEVKAMSIGKKYLMSLNQKGRFYVPAWGIYEVVGVNYADAQLVENTSIDDEALQLFINSAGIEKDFSFDYSGSEPVLIHNGQRRKAATSKKSILWYGVAVGVLVLTGSFLLMLKKSGSKT